MSINFCSSSNSKTVCSLGNHDKDGIDNSNNNNNDYNSTYSFTFCGVKNVYIDKPSIGKQRM